MSELEMPTVITAIANPEAEGFVAGTYMPRAGM
jgi:hypothetical protein